MRILVRFFAGCQEVAKTPSSVFDLLPGSTLNTLKDELARAYPPLTPYLERVRYAVNWEYVAGDVLLHDGDEIALIPPVAGGSSGDRCWITEEPISEQEVRSWVETPEAGAILVFLGVVRNHADGRPVRGLEYHAYSPMVEKTLAAVLAQARQRWSLHRVAIVHRVGRLDVGETSVAVAVSASHRRDAFEACSFIVERLKADAPIWKRELWADGGQRWVGDER